MSKDFREPRNEFSQLIQPFSLATLGFLILLVVAGGIFAYQVSPLRDPSFEPDSANAGSLIPWMRGVNEGIWMIGSFTLSGLLATNLVLILLQWSQPRTNVIPRFLLFMFWTGVAVILFGWLEMKFLVYLMDQWLVD